MTRSPALATVVSLSTVGHAGECWISKTPGVCGGDARIRNTHIPVWLVEAFRRSGATDEGLLNAYPDLTAADLELAREYSLQHPEEIDQAVRESEDA